MADRQHESDRDVDMTTRHVRGALAGDAQSVEWIVVRFSPVLRTQAEYRLHPRLRSALEPADLVHDVWLRALPKLDSFRFDGPRATPPFLRFLSQILLNQINNLYRKRIRGKPLVISGDGAPDATHESARVVTRIVRQETHDAVSRALAELSESDRELIVLRGIEQSPPRDVALLLGIKPNTVSVRYRRALERLRRALPDSVLAELPGGDDDESE